MSRIFRRMQNGIEPEAAAPQLASLEARHQHHLHNDAVNAGFNEQVVAVRTAANSLFVRQVLTLAKATGAILDYRSMSALYECPVNCNRILINSHPVYTVCASFGASTGETNLAPNDAGTFYPSADIVVHPATGPVILDLPRRRQHLVVTLWQNAQGNAGAQAYLSVGFINLHERDFNGQ